MPVQITLNKGRMPVKVFTKDIEHDAIQLEIPGAYKDIDVVMANQTDLVEVVRTLKQVICING